MAERRMFSKKITESDAFLDMPISTQCLYFHLNMSADDDGFVNNPKRIQRLINASDDDMRLLIAKSFIILFESGIIVIKHWKMHNYIQSDRYKPSDYIEEKSMLYLKKNKAYTLSENEMYTKCIQDVSVGKVRLGKNSIDNIYAQNENSNNKNENLKAEQIDDWENKFDKFYSQYPKKVSKQLVRKWFEKNKPDDGLFEVMMNSLEAFKKTKDWLKDNGQFIPYPSTWLNQKRWEDESITQEKKITNKPIEYKVLNTDEMTEEEYMKMIRGG